MSLLHDGPSDDVIPAVAVDELFRTVRIGLEQLQVEHQQAQLELVQLEAELATHVSDLQPGDDRIETARGAIEGVAIGAQEHLGKVIAAAHAHADARIAAADAEALWIVQAAREDVARTLAAPLGVGDPIPPADATLVLPVPPPVAELTGWAKEEPTTVAATPAPLPLSVTAPPAPSDPSPPVAPVAASGLEERAASTGEADSAFWSFEGTEVARARQLEGITTALLPMVALLILLVVVLAWIG